MKKIALITDGWKRYVTYAWVQGYRRYASQYHLDTDLYVFQSFGNFNTDEGYNSGEYNITRLPDLRTFDGIILDLSNVSDASLKESFLARVRESGVPAISLLEDLPGLYYSGLDNLTDFSILVEHLITEHGCRKLNYVGGIRKIRSVFSPTGKHLKNMGFSLNLNASLKEASRLRQESVLSQNFSKKTCSRKLLSAPMTTSQLESASLPEKLVFPYRKTFW